MNERALLPLLPPSARASAGLDAAAPEPQRKGARGELLWAPVIAAAVALTVALRSPAFSADTTDGRELLAQAVDGWKHIAGSMLPTTATATSVGEIESTDPTDPNFGKKKNGPKYLYKFWLTEKSQKVLMDVFDGSGKWKRRQVIASNPEYGFSARQTIENGPYFITSCLRDRQPLDQVNVGLRGQICNLSEPIGVLFERDSLPDIVTRDSFKLLGARHVEIDGRKYVEFQVSFIAGAGTIFDQKTPVRCTIVVDPAADWRVVRTSGEQGGQSETMEVSYGTSKGGNTLWKTVENCRYSNLRTSGVTEFDSMSHEPPPDSEFYLGSLGLPDCPASGMTRSRWLLFIAFDLLVLGAIFAFLYRRKRASTRAAPSK